jgi:uncharacterized protein
MYIERGHLDEKIRQWIGETVVRLCQQQTIAHALGINLYVKQRTWQWTRQQCRNSDGKTADNML